MAETNARQVCRVGKKTPLAEKLDKAAMDYLANAGTAVLGIYAGIW